MLFRSDTIQAFVLIDAGCIKYILEISLAGNPYLLQLPMRTASSRGELDERPAGTCFRLCIQGKYCSSSAPASVAARNFYRKCCQKRRTNREAGTLITIISDAQSSFSVVLSRKDVLTSFSFLYLFSFFFFGATAFDR